MSINIKLIDMNPQIPFNELPELPPTCEIETKAVLKRLIEARAALGELKQAANRIPNPTVLIHVLPTMEAQSSSEIENIVTTTDKLFQGASKGADVSDPATKEALNYRAALYMGFEEIKTRPLCTATAEAVCSRIRDTNMQVRKVPGTKLANDSTGEIIYTPPEGEDLLRSKLANWERFIHECEELDPLVRLAVSHYQFEAIHPFTDGNGRTGRILNLLFLVEQDLLDQPILYHSRGIIDQKSDYYRLLFGVTRDGAWEPWLLFMLKVIEETSLWTKNKIEGICNLQAHTDQYLKDHHSAAYHPELLDMIFQLPYCRISNAADLGILKRQSAARYLNSMVAAGVLDETKSGREKLFVHAKFMDLLHKSDNNFVEYPA